MLIRADTLKRSNTLCCSVTVIVAVSDTFSCLMLEYLPLLRCHRNEQAEGACDWWRAVYVGGDG